MAGTAEGSQHVQSVARASGDVDLDAAVVEDGRHRFASLQRRVGPQVGSPTGHIELPFVVENGSLMHVQTVQEGGRLTERVDQRVAVQGRRAVIRAQRQAAVGGQRVSNWSGQGAVGPGKRTGHRQVGVGDEIALQVQAGQGSGRRGQRGLR